MKKEWSEEERKAIEAKYRAELSPEELEKEYAEVLSGELIPFEEVIREVEEQQRRLDQEKA